MCDVFDDVYLLFVSQLLKYVDCLYFTLEGFALRTMMHTIQSFETNFSVCNLERVFHLKDSTMIIVIVSRMEAMNQKQMLVPTVYFIAHSKNGTIHC